MGIHRQASNRKTTIQRKKNQRTHRRKIKVIREKQGGIPFGDISDPELMTAHILKKRRTSPRANITLSGKKRRKLIKQLKHMEKDKERETTEDTEMPQAPTEKKQKNKKSKKTAQVEDVEMAEQEEEEAGSEEGEEEEEISE